MLLRFHSDCTVASLHGRCSVELIDAIDRALTFYEPGYRYRWEWKVGKWDGKYRLLKRDNLSFPAGLAHRVLTVLQALNLDAEIDDLRPAPPWGDEVPEPPTTLHDAKRGSIELYSNQREALAVFLEARRGCLQLPTSAGKTEIAAALIKVANPSAALMIVDRKALMSQTAERLEDRLQERVGMLGAGFRDDHRRVTVATIQTLWHNFSQLKKYFFPSIKVLVVDECHGISPKMWFRTLAEIPAPVRLGLSATIKEASRRLIVESFLGPIVYESSVRELINEGRAAEVRINLIRVGGVVPDGVSEQEAYERGIVKNTVRNRHIAQATLLASQREMPTLILVVRIEHGYRLQRMLEEVGVSAPFLYGGTPLDEVNKAKHDLGSGRIPALIASTIFDFGQDIPSIRLLVPAGGQRSPLRTIQRTGRGLRVKPGGENRVDVLDFLDYSCRMLQNQSDDRRKTYRRKFGEPRVLDSIDALFT